MPKPITVLVTGATGKQGGALARTLLARGHHVRGLTRSPDGLAARRLAAAGAEIVAGNFDVPETVVRAARGCDAAFVMGTPYEKGSEEETREGIAACDAVKAAGVGHILYSSVASADRNTRIPHFDSKWKVEQHLASLGVPWTVVAPVWFMENFASPWFSDGLARGKLALALPPKRKLQQIAVADVAEVQRIALERRSELEGKRIDIASDELTGPDVARAIARASGREIAYEQVPLEVVHQQSEDLARMYEWFDEVGYSADIAGLRRAYPDVHWHDFSAWAAEQDWDAVMGPRDSRAPVP